MRRRRLLTLSGIVLLLGLLWASVAPLYALLALPSGTGAWFVSYFNNQTYGVGPGGNETGFNVVLLSRKGAERVAAGGVDWLNAQPGGRIEPDWRATPVPRDEFWLGRASSAAGSWPEPTVRAILDYYGFGIDLPARHREAVDAALNAPGNFYAFGRGGLIVVVVPKAQRAYVFYAG